MKLDTPVTFEKFMDWALHDPTHGYYARRISGVGRTGDFTTAPMLSDSPARAIATWAAEAMRETGCRDLIETGPGEGTLAKAVLKSLPFHVRWRTRLHLVETSVPLREHQRSLLGKSSAIWHSNLASALRACDGRAVIFSNEFVDAFPVRRFQKTTLGWQELAVTFDSQRRAHESLLSPAPLPDSTAFQESHRLGQWVEVHESYQNYLKSWLPLWKAGRILTIDYGSTADQIYHRKPRGTLRGYLLHHRIEGPGIYENPGRQDLTADVNFTDLQNWSAPHLADNRLLTLGEFLRSPGPISDPAGAGGAFMVLDQKRAT